MSQAFRYICIFFVFLCVYIVYGIIICNNRSEAVLISSMQVELKMTQEINAVGAALEELSFIKAFAFDPQACIVK